MAKQTLSELQVVNKIQRLLQPDLTPMGLEIHTGHRLAYALSLDHYAGGGPLEKTQPVTRAKPYQTDFLVAEQIDNGWFPCLVIEFKLGSISTHELLTYSTKALTHKTIHPYLRYGLVVARHNRPMTPKFIQHGQHFDFMLSIPNEQQAYIGQLRDLILAEVDSARTMRRLLTPKTPFRLVRHRLVTDLD